jgi:MtN3 and saliva related transmembrane protein
MTLVDAIGAVGATLTTVCWLPQAVRIIRTRDTNAISLVGSMALTTGVFLWLVYGIAIGDVPLTGANVVTLTATILGLELRHGWIRDRWRPGAGL